MDGPICGACMCPIGDDGCGCPAMTSAPRPEPTPEAMEVAGRFIDGNVTPCFDNRNYTYDSESIKYRLAFALDAFRERGGGGAAKWYAMALRHLEPNCAKPCALHDAPMTCDLHDLDGMCTPCEARWLRNPQNSPFAASPAPSAEVEGTKGKEATK